MGDYAVLDCGYFRVFPGSHTSISNLESVQPRVVERGIQTTAKLAPPVLSSYAVLQCCAFRLLLVNVYCDFFSAFIMRAFARVIRPQQFGARSSFHRRSCRQHRRFATVNSQEIKGLTVIDHHYEYSLSCLVEPLPNNTTVQSSLAPAVRVYAQP